jgi:hypothetical protein
VGKDPAAPRRVVAGKVPSQGFLERHGDEEDRGACEQTRGKPAQCVGVARSPSAGELDEQGLRRASAGSGEDRLRALVDSADEERPDPVVGDHVVAAGATGVEAGSTYTLPQVVLLELPPEGHEVVDDLETADVVARRSSLVRALLHEVDELALAARRPAEEQEDVEEACRGGLRLSVVQSEDPLHVGEELGRRPIGVEGEKGGLALEVPGGKVRAHSVERLPTDLELRGSACPLTHERQLDRDLQTKVEIRVRKSVFGCGVGVDKRRIAEGDRVGEVDSEVGLLEAELS